MAPAPQPDARPGRPASAGLARRLLQAAVVAGLAAVFALVALFLSWHAILHIGQERLGAFSTVLLQRMAVLDREVETTLTAFNIRPEDMCSEIELEDLREQVYRTHYIKDIGRVRDGRIACTAAVRAVVSPAPAPTPDIVTADGLAVSASAPLLLARIGSAPKLGRDDTNIVLDPDAFDDQPLYGMSYSAGYVGGDGRYLRLYGAVLPLDDADVTRAVALDRDGTLYHPLCATGRPVCVVARLDTPALADQQWPLLLLAGLFGAIAGGAVALALLSLRSRAQSMEARLRHAIAHDELQVEYQPIVRLADGVTVGAEALVRWRDPNGRMISPALFIPLAEETGLVGRITRVVLHRVVAELHDLLSGPQPFRVSVNISANDLDDSGFYDDLARTLDAAGIAPDRIAVELTEHATLRREGAVAGTRRLRALGHRIYLDDFGTGYSSLSYLGDLEIDVLKLDRSFTVTVGGDAVRVSIVPEILGIARTLGIEVIVEGVETEAQAAWFRDAGVPYAQGWLFGRAVAAQALRERVERPTAPVA